MTDEVRKLLGGYATGTLTEEERALLYEAALNDAAVFEAMEDEQAVRDLLDDSSARAELLAAVQERPFSIAGALRDWFERPQSKVLIAIGMVILVAIGVRESKERHEPGGRDLVAVLRPAPATRPMEDAAPQPSAQTAPAPRTAEKKAETRAFGAPPPPPPPSPQATAAAPAVAATASDAQAVEAQVLSWSVLRVDAAGAVTPVERSYAFDSGEKARIRVESTQAGMLLAKQGEDVLYAGTISPGLPVVLRRDIAFTGAGEAPGIDLEWAPSPPAPVAAPLAAPPPPPAASARRDLRRAAPEAGVVGGVIGGVPSGQSMGFRQGDPVLEAAQQPVQRTRVRVQLRRKSP